MAQLVLPAELSAVSTARHWVSDQVTRCLTARPGAVDQDVLELLTSEAVANAVRHGAGPVTVAVVCGREHVCIAVTDTSPTVPVVRHVGPDATGGRGMALIDRLAARWGLTAASSPAGGKTVWFQLVAGP
ncbi:ATP-binding protein [Kineococcus sp. SYSU DK002]|uniref:ATP-binding protein n=1 Tax=Kineococcus sp. SYSU DK002 TaxID=3383123 RepID=UPI003D7DAA90